MRNHDMGNVHTGSMEVNSVMFFIFLLIYVFPIFATTYYVGDCQTGVDEECRAGDDVQSGTDPSLPWKSCAKAVVAAAHTDKCREWRGIDTERLPPGVCFLHTDGKMIHSAVRTSILTSTR